MKYAKFKISKIYTIKLQRYGLDNFEFVVKTQFLIQGVKNRREI